MIALAQPSAVHLYPINSKVQAANEQELRKLKEKEWKFDARDHRGIYLENDRVMNTMQKGIKTAEKLDKDVMAPRQLLLKEGAQVMLIKVSSNAFDCSRLTNLLCFSRI